MSSVEFALEKKLCGSSWGNLFLQMLSKIKYGTVVLTTPEGEKFNFLGLEKGEHVSIHILNWKFCEEIFLKGDIGLGESYIDGMWDCDNINSLIKFGIDNNQSLERVIKGSLLKIFFYRLKHNLNRNSRIGSKKNIHAHYDLGNSFYQLWLDPTMTYSSALFNGLNLSLEDAQYRKYQNILDQLDLKPDDHILEVGCGWGGFMEYAALKGIKVTGITISNEQYEFSKNRLKNYPAFATVKLMDYRDINEKYDHIISIEMFEALGEQYWETYFKILSSALNENGKLIIQSIIINDKDFSSYRKGTDFIQQYIFPGGMLPSPSAFNKVASKNNFKVIGCLEFGKDYALTLKFWEENFLNSLDSVKEIGFDDKFIRTWKFYLNYCRGGFEAGKIGVYQFYLKK